MAFNAETRATPASIVKVPLALAVLTAFSDGSFDPLARSSPGSWD